MYNKCIFCLLGVFLFACDKFVDEPKPTADITAQKAFSSSKSMEAVFSGIYRRIRFFGDGDGDDAEGIGAILNTWNVKGNDIVRTVFSWFVFEYRYQDVQSSTGRKSNHIWNEMYEIVGTCNTVLANMDKSTLPEETKTLFIAEARGLRGWAYHHLIRDYAQPYSRGVDAPGVPIRTAVPTLENIGVGNPRATVGEVYKQIVSDLEFASANLTNNRAYKWAINKNVADGFLARVYLYMALYEKAAKSANAARQGYSLNAAQYKNGFQNIGDAEWMWGAPQTNNQTLYYGSFSSIWDGTRYARVYVNINFVNKFSKTDVRNTFSKKGKEYPDTLLYATSKFAAAADFSEDLVLMRVAEMYLIEAEARARMGNDTEAARLLYELQSNRDKALTAASGNRGEALIKELMLERRKELYGECGPDFIDARRLGIGLVRDSVHSSVPGGRPISLTPGDSRYIQKIPQGEIDNNDKISKADQNP